MSENEQATSTPFEPAVLKVHDSQNDGTAKLMWAREFGTNVNASIGDAYTATPAVEADPSAVVDANLGMLKIVEPGTDPHAESRGRTFLTPPWSTFPPSPNLGPGIIAAVLYARLVLQEGIDVSPSYADLVLAPSGFVGNQPAAEFATISIQASQPVAGDDQPNQVQAIDWTDGGTVDSQDNADGFDPAVYIRGLITTDGATSFNMSVFASLSGIGWRSIGDVSRAFVLQRIGLGVRSEGSALLDYVRLYSYVIDSLSALPSPLPPAQGGRLFL